MAAYSAVVCFRQTLQQLLASDQLPLHFSRTQIEHLYEKVSSLQSSLDKTPLVPKDWRNHWNELQNKIRDAVYAAQDKIDYSIIGKAHLSPEKADGSPFNDIAAAIDPIAEKAEDMVEAIIRKVPQAQHLVPEEPPPAESKSDSKDKTTGLEEDLNVVKDMLSSEDPQQLVIPITGLPGVGKTTLARKIYEDEETKAQFSIRAWATVSGKSTFNKILFNLLSSIKSKEHEAAQGDEETLLKGDEETLLNLLRSRLYNHRYLIVIDDVWDADVTDRVAQVLPDAGNRSRVLITTRNPTVGRYIQKYGYVHVLKDKFVGQEEDFEAVTDLLLPSRDLQRLVIPIIGPPGIGKSTLARRIYEDEGTKAQFKVRAWVTVSRKYTFHEIFSELLSYVVSEGTQNGDEETLLNLLHHELYNSSYLVVIDNMWEAKVWDTVAKALPDTGNGSRVLVTTRNPKVCNSIQEEYGYAHTMESSETSTSSSVKVKIVGQEQDFKVVADLLMSSADLQRLVIPITGLPGLGKTTLARTIYENRQVRNSFDVRAWVTVSQDCNYQEVFSNLLSSMESKNYEVGNNAMQGDEQAVMNRFHDQLYNQKYLVVIDDVWDIETWDKISVALPDKENGSRVLVTTRIPNVANCIQREGYIHTMQPLGLVDSWQLLCYKVFDEVEGDEDITKACPPDLKDIGRRIAEKCKGLPLSITVVGGLLRQEQMNAEYWKRIEEDVGGAVATQGDESYLEILSLSYTQLPPKLKACFLYMGAFPEDSEIRVSKLIKLWVAEGFLTSQSPLGPPVELVAQTMLEDLVGRNLVGVRRKSSDGGIKVCGLHDSLRELAERVSRIEKFFHSRKKYGQPLERDIEEQRRVSVHNNLLMSHGEVYESTRSIRHARTLLYMGPHHHHPLPFCLTFDLLRVLDAFTVYFIRFPNEFLQLVHLTYLSLTYNHELPPKISQLQKLQALMVRREPKLIFVGASFLPDEIWEMPELRHLWFTESDFPPLPSSPPPILLLPNLQTLTNVNAAYFTDEVLHNMPNLKKLAMWIEAPDVLNFNVSKLHQLEHFKFVVLNPIPGKGVEVEAEQFFPRTLKRLNLSGCGLPWEYMEYVANLPHLEVLKLKELAFHGDEWCLDYNLESLKYLLIEYLNFQRWEANYSNYPILEKLILRHCYELEEIPQDLGFIATLELLELVDCSPNAVGSANAIREEQEEDYDNMNLHVRIFSSWD